MTLRFRRVRASLLALAASSFCLAALSPEADARSSGSHRRHAKAMRPPKAPAAEHKAAEAAEAADAASPPAKPSGVWASGEQDRACFRTRRKLWQDGEGWVVKRVSVCP